jgi:hypothetical protein
LISSIAISDLDFLAAFNDKLKEMLSIWTKVAYASTTSDKLVAWNNFKIQYSSEVFLDILIYIKKEWLNIETAK